MEAQIRAAGLATAVSTAVNRYSGATVADSTHWQQMQRSAARLYAGQLAASLNTELADAKHAQRILAHTAFRSLKLTTAKYRALKARVAAHGIPQPVAGDLARLGLPAGDLARVRVDLEQTAQTKAAAFPTPVSFLTALDPPTLNREILAAITALHAFARTGK
jgi:hypothetical protein